MILIATGSTYLYARQMVLRLAAVMGVTTVVMMSLMSPLERGRTWPFSPRMDEHLFNTLSEAPLVRRRCPPLGRGMTVDLHSFKVKTLIKLAGGCSSLMAS